MRLQGYFIGILIICFMCTLCIDTFADINEGLVVYYPFNGNANDESGSGNHGTVHGATLTEDRNGNPDSAYDFDGVDDYIRLLSKVEFASGNTVVFWLKSDSANSQYLMSSGTGFDNRFAIHSTYISLQYASSPQNNFILFHDVSILDWHHYVLVRNGATIDLYADGQFVDNDTQSSQSISVDNIAGKTNPNSVWAYFDGSMDEIRIYNRALSESEIQELFVDTTTTTTALITTTTTTPTGIDFVTLLPGQYAEFLTNQTTSFGSHSIVVMSLGNEKLTGKLTPVTEDINGLGWISLLGTGAGENWFDLSYGFFPLDGIDVEIDLNQGLNFAIATGSVIATSPVSPENPIEYKIKVTGTATE